MTQRAFTSEDQLAFARLSGDHNPLHMDPAAARRLMFGKQIVHGMHALLWGLDQYFTDQTRFLQLVKIQAGFQNGIGIGETVRCSFTATDEDSLEIRLAVNGTLAVWVQVTWAARDEHHRQKLPEESPGQPDCRERSVDELNTAAGSLPLYLDRQLARELLPDLFRVLPETQLAGLLATTRLVGMECPGLHSIFSGLEITYSAAPAAESEMAYQAVTCNPKVSLLLMRIRSEGMEGKIKAFLRPEPRQQATFSEISSRVKPEEFASQEAVVIGGSRGLGEVTAKLLAAGGADVTITYFSGRADAHRIVTEMTSRGAKASCYRLNVLDPSPDLQSNPIGGSKPISLYYFATPFIFGATRSKFSSSRFITFCDYYVGGYLRTVEELMAHTGRLEKIFYPSTSAIDEMPLDMGEYAAAKAAGETSCDFLEKARPAIKIIKPRLPRLPTDQTVSLLPVASQEPVSLLLSHLRRLRDL
jgi:acyl dehydratase